MRILPRFWAANAETRVTTISVAKPEFCATLREREVCDETDSWASFTGMGIALAAPVQTKADKPRGVICVSEPNSWNDLVSDAYAVAAVLGVGGYILAMLAL